MYNVLIYLSLVRRIQNSEVSVISTTGFSRLVPCEVGQVKFMPSYAIGAGVAALPQYFGAVTPEAVTRRVIAQTTYQPVVDAVHALQKRRDLFQFG